MAHKRNSAAWYLEQVGLFISKLCLQVAFYIQNIRVPSGIEHFIIGQRKRYVKCLKAANTMVMDRCQLTNA